jgi:pilus assembly protein Flp/PilA
MQRYFQRIRHFISSEEGPTAVEYAVMLALIVVVCLSAVRTLGTNSKTTFNNIATSIGS